MALTAFTPTKRIAIAATAVLLLALAAAAIVGLRRSTAPAPPKSPSAVTSMRHENIVTTIFWAGESGGSDNGNIPNSASAWDETWAARFGGVDDPGSRNGYNPAGFTPKENPFYVALPYNDLNAQGNRKATAAYCRELQPYPDDRYSFCKNIWVAITKQGKTVYAQWEDVGPFNEDDAAYVFGTAKPANTQGAQAGLDVSPAVRDALGLQDVDRTSWRFVTAADVPDGPWKQTISTYPGEAL